MRRATLTIAAIGILIALGAGTAVAQSGLDQYQENVPGAGGGGRGDGAGGGGGGGGGSGTEAGTAAGTGVLAPETAEELEALGADGEAAADIAEGTAPEGAGGAGGAGGDKGASGDGAGAGDDGGGGLAGVGDVLDQVVGGSDDGDGMGVLLPILLALAVIGALLIALAVRRGRQGTGPAGNA